LYRVNAEAPAGVPRRRRLAFAATAVLLTIALPSMALLAADIYLHGRFQTSAGYNVWGYRGPAVGRKKPGEIRIAVLGGSSAYGYGVNWSEAMPVQLERALAARSSRRFTVVNLGYNNEGAYSLKFTLQDYAYLEYDVAILYENYNDLMNPPEFPNLSVYRRDSPVFRLTGYLPIFPIVFKEKAAIMLHGGDAGALYRQSGKTTFSPSVANRAAAGVLNTTAEIGQSLERQLDRVTAEPPRRVVGGATSGCTYPWGVYCRSMLDAAEYAVAAGKRVLVVGQPYEAGASLRPHHMEQQRELEAAVTRRFGGDERVRYVNLGTTVEVLDPAMSFDRMHLTPQGNVVIANALVQPVLDLTSTLKVSIQPVHVVDEAIDPVALDDVLPAARTHRAPPVRVVEQRDDRLGQRLRVAERREPPDVGSGQHVADAADVGADARHSGSEALDERDRRAFVSRRQQEHVGRAVDGGEIAAPAEKPRPSVNAERARRALQLAAQHAVAGDEEQRARIARGDAGGRIQEQPMLLDRRQPADRGDDARLLGDGERRSRHAAILVGQRRERREIEPERDHAILRGRSDAMLVEELSLDLRRDGDDGVGGLRELALGRREELRRAGREIPVEHVAVVRVHDARWRVPSDRAVVSRRGQTAERARLGHVRVDDRRAEAAERAIQRCERDDVVRRGDRTAERLDMLRADAPIREQILHVALAGAERAVDQKRVDAPRRQTLGQGHRLNGRPADVQAGDDSRHAHRSDNTTRLSGGRQA
jgi:hypothetical protein